MPNTRVENLKGFERGLWMELARDTLNLHAPRKFTTRHVEMYADARANGISVDGIRKMLNKLHRRTK